MLVTCRQAGLSALEAHYARLGALTQWATMRHDGLTRIHLAFKARG
jgi:hypothetical protein